MPPSSSTVHGGESLMVSVGDDRRRLPVEAAHETACGDEDLARHVLREVAREIGVGRRHVLGRGSVECGLRADVVQQAPSVQLGDVALVLRAGRQPRLRAGADHIRPHPVLLELCGDGQRQPVDPALARRIAGAAVVTEVRERTGVDDRPAALLDHLRGCGPARLERRDEVCLEQVVEQLARDVEDRLGGQPRRARAVDQDIDPAEFACAPVDQSVGDIGVSG